VYIFLNFAIKLQEQQRDAVRAMKNIFANKIDNTKVIILLPPGLAFGF
jgi:hypothetical protein